MILLWTIHKLNHFELDEIGSLFKSIQKAGIVHSKDADRQYLICFLGLEEIYFWTELCSTEENA